MRTIQVLLLSSILALGAWASDVVQVTGQIVLKEGGPAAKALVAVHDGAMGNLKASKKITCDSEGRFQVAVSPGDYVLTATYPGYCSGHLKGLKAEPGKDISGVRLELKTGGYRITGQMINNKRQPQPGGEIAFSGFDAEGLRVHLGNVTGASFSVDLAPGVYLIEATSGDLIARDQEITLAGDLSNLTIQLRPGPSQADSIVKSWIKANAIPLSTTEAEHGFADLKNLRNLIGNARVVSLGEATHGSREIFQVKHRMLEFLVEQMGFSVFAIEAGMTETRAINDFILEGRGEAEKALSGLDMWTWDTKEVLEMIRWMRRYNQDPSHVRKVKFYGFDTQNPHLLYSAVKAFLNEVESLHVSWYEANFAPLSKLNRSNSQLFTPDIAKTCRSAALELLARFDLKKADFIAAKGKEAYELAKRDVLCIAQFSESIVDPPTRERAMADNVLWILDREQGAKVLLWAHNYHVSKFNMGHHLHKSLGTQMVVFGFVFRKGGFQAYDGGPENKGVVQFDVPPHPKATLADALSSANKPVFILDLRGIPAKGGVRDWFERGQGSYEVGALFSREAADSFIFNHHVFDGFDALIFIENTTAARSNPTGRRGPLPRPQ